MIINFDNKGNAGVRCEVWEDSNGNNKWSAWVDLGLSLENKLNKKQKAEVSEMKIDGNGYPSPIQSIDAICSLIRETKSEKHHKLGIEINRVMVEDELKELLLFKTAEQFGMKPFEGVSVPAENKS